ncbi:MAG: hypothetical protein ACKVP7_06415 [Hyphomicrobiaceae bacterium]
MRADDVFRAELHDTIRALRAWAESLSDVATVDLSEADRHWRLRLVPHEAAACPVEVILYSDQRFDLAVGPETYEGLAALALSRFAPLLDAITQGRVVTRTWSTLATGAHLATATIVEAADGPWQHERETAAIARAADRDACSVRDRHYAPYRRPL